MQSFSLLNLTTTTTIPRKRISLVRVRVLKRVCAGTLREEDTTRTQPTSKEEPSKDP